MDKVRMYVSIVAHKPIEDSNLSLEREYQHENILE